MGNYKKKLGEIGENYAIKYLKSKGYKILARNVHFGKREIDIISFKNNSIVFVEVKTRNEDKYVDILDSIGEEKKESLISSCEEYLSLLKSNKFSYRIDLLGIVIRNNIIRKFEHIKGII